MPVGIMAGEKAAPALETLDHAATERAKGQRAL